MLCDLKGINITQSFKNSMGSNVLKTKMSFLCFKAYGVILAAMWNLLFKGMREYFYLTKNKSSICKHHQFLTDKAQKYQEWNTCCFRLFGQHLFFYVGHLCTCGLNMRTIVGVQAPTHVMRLSIKSIDQKRRFDWDYDDGFVCKFYAFLSSYTHTLCTWAWNVAVWHALGGGGGWLWSMMWTLFLPISRDAMSFIHWKMNKVH